jgi:hypothetical protein
VQHLVRSIGPRHATSLAEAQAAAAIDGWLRQIGMGVSADTFRAPRNSLMFPLLLALLGIIIMGIAVWLPLLALLLALWCLLLILSDALLAPVPVFGFRRDSQNIVGTYPHAQPSGQIPAPPRWRVVLLAPLDSPAAASGLHRLTGQQHLALLARIAAFGLLALLNLLLLLESSQARWWYAQAMPVAALLLVLLPLLLPAAPQQASTRATSTTGALAVLLSAAPRLRVLRSIELWVVALGATTTGSSGLHDLFTRYPFSKESTLVIALDKVGSGQLTYASREGMLQQWCADSLLLQSAAAMNARYPVIDAVPRPYRAASSIAAPLHRQGYRVLTLISDDEAPRTHAAGSSPVEGEYVDYQAVARAVRLVVGIVQNLDDEVA